MNKILGLLLLLVATSAYADATCQEALNTVYNCGMSTGLASFSGLSWSTLTSYGMAFLMVASVALRLLAEALGWAANKSKNTWDNHLVHILMDFVNFLGKLIGWFGGGKPRSVK